MQSVGIATHFNYYDLLPYGRDRAKTVESLTAIGARFVRDGLIVNVTGETNDPFWNTMSELTHAGMKLVLITYPTQQRNGVFDSFPYPDQRPIDTAIARVGAENILAFEGPNEVDNNAEQWGGADAFAANARAYQSAMYAHVKHAAPTISVIGLTATKTAGARAVGDLSAVMDAGTLHPYPGGDIPTAELARTEEALAPLNRAKKPWWVTETGYYTAPNATEHLFQPGVSETAQAKYIPRTYLDYFRAGIPYTAVYELIDEHDDLSDAEMNFGLLHNDGSPKPAYASLRNLLLLLADRGPAFTPGTLDFTLAGATPTVRQLLLEKRDGRFYLVLWNDVAVYRPRSVGGVEGRLRKLWERFAGVDSTSRDVSNSPVAVTLSLARAAHTLSLYAPLKGVPPLSVDSNSTSLIVPVPDYPVVVEIRP